MYRHVCAYRLFCVPTCAFFLAAQRALHGVGCAFSIFYTRPRRGMARMWRFSGRSAPAHLCDLHVGIPSQMQGRQRLGESSYTRDFTIERRSLSPRPTLSYRTVQSGARPAQASRMSRPGVRVAGACAGARNSPPERARLCVARLGARRAPRHALVRPARRVGRELGIARSPSRSIATGGSRSSPARHARAEGRARGATARRVKWAVARLIAGRGPRAARARVKGPGS